ncbi:MAG TPA: YbhB/YbcL family Raf kinase inhibitor-like protein [Candidatus Elarobacter sp.]|jgi:hypothetical protein|nr:YbhB/YbcL family Raf kinase inhibitor-like protein [Candidatus Elarobacter sp.]
MRTWTALAAATALAAGVAGCNNNNATPTTTQGGYTETQVRAPLTGSVPALTVTSSAFSNGGAIPTNEGQNGCGGTNVSPDLTWSGAPAATKSFVITEFDPDAPTGSGFWHWVLYNIPPTTTSIAAGAGTNPPSGTSGLTDYGSLGYGGPCPPVGDGPHHYHFTVSALDTMLSGMPANSTGAYVVFNMGGHVLAQGTYLGTYAR